MKDKSIVVRTALLALVASVLMLGTAISYATAAELVASDDLELRLGGLGEVGTSVTQSTEHDPAPPATTLRLARLSAAGVWRDIAGFKLQVEGRTGTLELLDLAVDARPTEWLTLTAGQFKMPVSREFLIPADQMRFSKRALIRQLAPGRNIGLESAVDTEMGSVGLEAAVGLFQPGRGVLANQGQLLIARTAIEPLHGLEIHAAFAEHVFGDNAYLDTSTDPAERRPVFAYDRQLDAALGFHGEQLHLLAEGLVVLDAADGEHPWAMHASGAYRFEVSEVGLEPALAYDVLEDGDERTHRTAVAMNTYWLETDVMTTLEYELEMPNQGTQHMVSLLFQVGF